MSRATHRLVLIALALQTASSFAHADDHAVVYSTGEIRTFDSTDPGHPFRINPAAPTKGFQTGDITFNVTFEDVRTGSGIGFDDPVDGVAFQNRLGDVFNYIDSVLDHAGSVDIMFDVSDNDTGTGFLAFAGPIFLFGSGISNGTAFDRLTTGVDDDPLTAEISARVNFGFDWFAGQGNPPNNQFDFFATLLHEIAHGLGFVGVIQSDGTSAISDVYTVWDSLTVTGGGQALVSGGVSPAFVGSTADLVSENLFFAGASAAAALGFSPPIFAPNPFQDGSSLSHFDPAGINVAGGFIMAPSGGPGAEPRQFAAFELGALADIGYNIETEVINPQSPVILVNPGSFTGLPAAGGIGQVNISNTGAGTLSWTADTDVEWITFDNPTGTGDGVLFFNVDENTLEFSDSGTIIITDPNASNSPVRITVTQLGIVVEPGCAASQGLPARADWTGFLCLVAVLCALCLAGRKNRRSPAMINSSAE